MKVFKNKSNTNSIKAMNSIANTPDFKTKNFDSTIKSILREVEDKVGLDANNDNNYINFKNKEKITSKIIEKYKKQIKDKEKNVKSKILVTSYKDDLGNHYIPKNKSVEHKVMVSEINIEKDKDEKIKQIVSHRGLSKGLNLASINSLNLPNLSIEKENGNSIEIKDNNLMIDDLMKITKGKQSNYNEPGLKSHKSSHRKEIFMKEKESNPNLQCENKDYIPQYTQNNQLTKTKKITEPRNIQISNILKKLGKRKDNEDDEYFDYEEEKKAELTNEEKIIYGNRDPKGFMKIKLLGKGGCGVVWLVKNTKNEIFAMKQISKKNVKTDVGYLARKEIEIINFLSNSEENNTIIKLYDYIEDSNDFWLIFEKGGHNFSNLLFKIKGDFHNNERIYYIQKGKFLKFLFQDLSLFKNFFKKMISFVDYLAMNGIVHNDIKPDNILIEYKVRENDVIIENLKMIDFGSAFYFKSPDCFNSNTPEYMSPEVNEINEKGGNNINIGQFMKDLLPWSIDMWSVGVTILEVVLACPLWISYKTKIKRNNKVFFTTGLFGVKGRNNAKIFQKQIEVVKSLKSLLQDCLIIDPDQKEKFINLMQRILDINWKTRISPCDALNHEFFN